jgi:hypothetical protein
MNSGDKIKLNFSFTSSRLRAALVWPLLVILELIHLKVGRFYLNFLPLFLGYFESRLCSSLFLYTQQVDLAFQTEEIPLDVPVLFLIH